MKKSIFVLIGGGLLLTVFLGIPQDAIQALRGTQKGDHVRYFKYLQTARHEGFPAALMKYGVKP